MSEDKLQIRDASKLQKSANETAIYVENVSKAFDKNKHARSLKSAIIGFGNQVSGKREKILQREHFLALQDISFEVKKGEFFGIVGRNGSGKSTLLKILAGVYQPTNGNVTINGKLTPFIELGVGFNPELSGHDNTFLNGALLGFSRKDMKRMYADIVNFAELEGFMDMKLKNYSSGMQVRLAFSIATRSQSDILLLDEVLAVGDSVFQQKCFDYFAEIKKSGRTVCFVSHDAETMRKYCDRGVLIKNGEIKLIGNITAVLNEYQKDLSKTIDADEAKKANKSKAHNYGVRLKDIAVMQNNVSTKIVKAYKDFQLKLSVSSDTEINKANIGINIITQQGQLIHAFNSQQLGVSMKLQRGSNTIMFELQNVLTDGKYSVNLAIVDLSLNKLLFQQESATAFKIAGITGHKYSLIHPRVEVSVQ